LEQGGLVLALDVEEKGYKEFVKKLGARSGKLDKLVFRKENFAKLGQVLKEVGWEGVDGILYDLGMSSWQIDNSGRGFSYLRDESLDMRMDNRLGVTAADLLNALSEKDLYGIFNKFGEEINAFRFARAITRARRVSLFKRTEDLRRALKTEDIKALARIFQSLRIAVNDELGALESSLRQAVGALLLEGRLVAISFHSLEDRVIKNLSKSFRQLEPIGDVVLPSDLEAAANQRSRSAKMRVFKKRSYEKSEN
jgi:16S rRNA (cytosine1402-N4)-methyltransferase